MSQILLRYDVKTDPFPLQASSEAGEPTKVILTVIATNLPANAPVTLQGLIIQLPIGEGSAQLTAQADDIGPVPPAEWSTPTKQYSDGVVNYNFTPVAGQTMLAGNESLVFVFNNIEVNSQPGTCQLIITEGSNGCQPADCPTQELYVTKFPAGWGQVLFWAEPPIVPFDGTTTLYWSGPAGAAYTIDYYTPQTGPVRVPGPGQPALSNRGQYPAQGSPPLKLEQNPTLFYLTVAETIEGQDYNAQIYVPITVQMPRPEIVSFTISANPRAPDEPPSFTLDWELKSALLRITATDGPGGRARLLPIPPDAAYNSYPVAPTQRLTIYTLTAYAQDAALTTTREDAMTTDDVQAGANPSQQATAIINLIAMPLGSIISYAGAQDPPILEIDGSAQWLLCDGRALDANAYPELFDLINHSFGDGTQRNPNEYPRAFNLPDLRGCFVRGTDDMGGEAAGRDPDMAARQALLPGGSTGASADKIGSFQADSFRIHTHDITPRVGTWHRSFEGNNDPQRTVCTGFDDYGLNVIPAGGSETRPLNVYLNFIIRVK